VSAQKPREIAARILSQQRSGQFVERLLERALAETRLSTADRGLLQELVYGVVRWEATLDWLIARKSKAPPKPAVQDLLRLGLYQIFWLERIPPHAAVNETVELTRRARFSAQAGFVNAVLRGYIREADATRQMLNELKKSEPHLGFSHPKWLVDRWQARWGADKTAQLLDWNNTPPKTYARVNTLKADPGKLLTQWRDENVEYDFVRRDWFEENLVFELRKHPPLNILPSFQQGLFYVQDPSTLLAARELDPRPGETILDLCAAPGGKLTYIAQLMQNQGRIIAHDTSPDRLKLIQENCTRLGVACAELVRPSFLEQSMDQMFDRVLVDVPCSNTGVMRRRVDLRWRIEPAELDRLRQAQFELLTEAARRLKPGRTLIYSTCSLEPDENENVIRDWLRQNPGFELKSSRELLPFVEKNDGAYVAKLIRKPC